MTVPSYPKIVAVGKLEELFNGDVEVTEKVDGSQFGFGLDHEGNLVMRSKGAHLNPPIDGMFKRGVDSILDREELIRRTLSPGDFVYGEYLNTPSHNTLKYDRVPLGHVALFSYTHVDEHGHEEWYTHSQMARAAFDMDLDFVPLLAEMSLDPDRTLRSSYVDRLKELMQRESYLGGEKVEGVVVKNLGARVHYNGRLSPVFCKLVGADFKERHNESWTPAKDLLQEYLQGFKAPARWLKTIHRLRDEDQLVNDVQDIGKIIQAVQADLVLEEEQQIKDDLYKHFLPQIKRVCTHGLAEFYKKRLAESRELVTNA